MEKKELENAIDSIVKESYPNAFWGSCALWDGVCLGPYSHVIVTVFPFSEMLTLKGYKEPHFREIQYATFPFRNEFEAKMSEMLEENGVPHHVVVLPDLSKTMTAEFSVKEAARRAGLGWIGKNNLLITPGFGPRISMSGILVDAPLDDGVPMDKSHCGDCRKCVDACLFKVLSGVQWEPGIAREQMVNYQLCSDGRNRAKATKLGRKLACGKCIVSCPMGTEEGWEDWRDR